jgi:hypothetical protein
MGVGFGADGGIGQLICWLSLKCCGKFRENYSASGRRGVTLSGAFLFVRDSSDLPGYASSMLDVSLRGPGPASLAASQ